MGRRAACGAAAAPPQAAAQAAGGGGARARGSGGCAQGNEEEEEEERETYYNRIEHRSGLAGSWLSGVTKIRLEIRLLGCTRYTTSTLRTVWVKSYGFRTIGNCPSLYALLATVLKTQYYYKTQFF